VISSTSSAFLRAALADAKQENAPAGTAVSRHQTNPGREFADGFKGFRLPHGRDGCGCCE
jgi:hypothetical protein